MEGRRLVHGASVALAGTTNMRYVGRSYIGRPNIKMPLLATTSQSLLDRPHGKRLLAVLSAVAFLDFVDASITNVALPQIRTKSGPLGSVASSDRPIRATACSLARDLASKAGVETSGRSEERRLR